MSAATRVTLLAAAWAAALALLAYRWALTPLEGSGPAFLIWSVPALPLAVLSWLWLRRLALPQLPLRGGLALGLALLWGAAAGAALSGLGEEWVLDGLILRHRLQQWGGLALRWLPGGVGAGLSVAGLAAALEARYRVTRRISPTGP